MAWWTGSNNVVNYYWDGQHQPTEHVCACDAAGDCADEVVTCNCDVSAPEWMSDKGILTDMTALPVKELSFGGLKYDGQQAQFLLGPLTCSGRKVRKPRNLNSYYKLDERLRNDLFCRIYRRRNRVKHCCSQDTRRQVTTSSMGLVGSTMT